MSLRLQINLFIAGLMILFIGAVAGLQVSGTRDSVREEIAGANRVAALLLARVHEASGMAGMPAFLQRLGRVRANDILLYDETGTLLYRSPEPTYKSGRDAPGWYARLVSPAPQAHEIRVGTGLLVVRGNASRAVLDGWDALVRLLWVGGAALVAVNVLAFWIADRIIRPLNSVARGLERIQQGDYAARLPPLPGREARLMGEAFNRTAKALAEGVRARQQADEADRRLQENRELAQMIQAHVEEERRSIARELHDELGQSITAVKSLGRSIAHRNGDRDPTIAEAAHLIIASATGMYDAVHEMIPRLRPFSLDSFGLADALADLAGQHLRHHPEIGIRLEMDEALPPLDDAVSTCAYRIAQESIVNVLRHAGARSIVVSVHAAADWLIVEIRDDGTGPVADVETPGRHGIRGMRERAAALGGSFALEALPEGGMRVIAKLPLRPP